MDREHYSGVIQKIKDVGQKYLSEDSHIFLYGSRARGGADRDSDWDILVLINKPKLEQSDYDGICYALTFLGWEIGEMIIPVLYTKKEWDDYSFSPFYKNVLSDRIVII